MLRFVIYVLAEQTLLRNNFFTYFFCDTGKFSAKEYFLLIKRIALFFQVKINKKRMTQIKEKCPKTSISVIKDIKTLKIKYDRLGYFLLLPLQLFQLTNVTNVLR